MGKLITLPFAALLRWMYSITGSYGVAIILFSLILKLVLLPFCPASRRSCRSNTQKISRNIRRNWLSSIRRRASTP